MPRSSYTGKLIFDPEIEKTVRRTRRKTRQLREKQSSAASQRPYPEIESTKVRLVILRVTRIEKKLLWLMHEH